MNIIVTGTPGTGKSTFAEKLAEELDRDVVNITEELEDRGLDAEWDAKRNCFLVDVAELDKVFEDIAKHDKDAIIDGHLSHYMNPEHVERCVVTKCELPELKKRLQDREYDEDKVRENLDCEIFDVCYMEALEQGHTPEVVWTS